MKDGRSVWIEVDGERVTVHVATGPRPWAFRLTAAAAAELAEELAAWRRAERADRTEPRGRGAARRTS